MSRIVRVLVESVDEARRAVDAREYVSMSAHVTNRANAERQAGRDVIVTSFVEAVEGEGLSEESAAVIAAAHADIARNRGR